MLYFRRGNLKLIFYFFTLALIVFLNIGLYLPFLKGDEEDICSNINRLKKYKWFQDLLNNKNYKELIVYDKDVRKVIGKFSGNKIDSKFFQNIYRKKLHNTLHQKSNCVA